MNLTMHAKPHAGFISGGGGPGQGCNHPPPLYKLAFPTFNMHGVNIPPSLGFVFAPSPPPLSFGTMHLPPIEQNPEINTVTHCFKGVFLIPLSQLALQLGY